MNEYNSYINELICLNKQINTDTISDELLVQIKIYLKLIKLTNLDTINNYINTLLTNEKFIILLEKMIIDLDLHHSDINLKYNITKDLLCYFKNTCFFDNLDDDIFYLLEHNIDLKYTNYYLKTTELQYKLTKEFAIELYQIIRTFRFDPDDIVDLIDIYNLNKKLIDVLT